MSRVLIIGVKDLKKLIQKRINNRYDCNIIVTGKTGIGKSTVIYQILKKFRSFKIEDKLTYSRTEFIHLIKDFKRSVIWNDELIGSAFKRNFFEREQIQLIEILTKYRSNYNVVMGALPVFFTLDKELLKLFRVHIQVIARGKAILHLPKEGRMYSDDIWDVKYNKTLEDRWSKKREKNPNFKIPYHKLSTFKAYLFFDPLTEEEEEKYEKLKDEKRNAVENPNEEEKKKKETFYEKLIVMVKEGNLTNDELLQICKFNGKKFSSVKSRLNQILRDEGKGENLKMFLKTSSKGKVTKDAHDNNLLPQGDISVNDL